MQVDTAALRAAAKQLRDEAAENLRRATIQAQRPEKEFGVEAAFDDYVTAAPYREVAAAWESELELLTEAARQLADSLDATAADYDATDQRAAGRLAGPR
jgi:uncharacterized protein YukE